MTVRVFYMADPPQWARLLGKEDSVTPWSAQVGDLISGWNYYKCTTAGTTAAGYLDTTGFPATITHGSSVWTRIEQADTAISWATAGRLFARSSWIGTHESVICYVDSEAVSSPQMTEITAADVVVYVHPTTMTPKAGRFSLKTQVDDVNNCGAVFFANSYATGGYYASVPLLQRHKAVGASAAPYAYLYTVDCDVLTIAASPTNGSSWGCRTWASAYALCSGYGGYLTSDYVGASVASGVGYGCHTKTPVDRTTTETYSVSTASFMRAAPANYDAQSFNGTNNIKPNLPGVYCSVAHFTSVYRVGAAPAGDTPWSMYVALSPTLINDTFIAETPRIVVDNTLTGSRTVKVYFITNSPFALDNKDLYVEVAALTSALGAATFITTQHADIGLRYRAGTALTIDAVSTWEATLLSLPTQYVVSIPVTFAVAGPLTVSVVITSQRLRKSSVFICPYVEVV